MQTSPGEKEGKTTVATRLALAAANSGLRVVLVDGDLRRGRVAVRLGLKSEQGADVEQLTPDGFTARQVAEASGHPEIAALLDG